MGFEQIVETVPHEGLCQVFVDQDLEEEPRRNWLGKDSRLQDRAEPWKDPAFV